MLETLFPDAVFGRLANALPRSTQPTLNPTHPPPNPSQILERPRKSRSPNIRARLQGQRPAFRYPLRGPVGLGLGSTTICTPLQMSAWSIWSPRRLKGDTCELVGCLVASVQNCVRSYNLLLQEALWRGALLGVLVTRDACGVNRPHLSLCRSSRRRLVCDAPSEQAWSPAGITFLNTPCVNQARVSAGPKDAERDAPSEHRAWELLLLLRPPCSSECGRVGCGESQFPGAR